MPGPAVGSQTLKKSAQLERAHAAVEARKEPRSFGDAFSKALFNRAGIKMHGKLLAADRMDRDLQNAHKIDGFAGDAVEKTADVGKMKPDGPVKPLPWGEEDQKELDELLKKLGPRDSNISAESFIKPFFRHLRLQDYAIRDLDADIMKFSRLSYLDVSNNPLRAIGALPPSLKKLKAYNTNICRVTCQPTPSLVFLGLGHTPIETEGLNEAAQRFPGLLSLDLSNTQILSLSDVALAVQSDMQQLRQLCLAGTPASLLPYYRLKSIKKMPQLQYLDSAPISDAEMVDANLLNGKPPAPPKEETEAAAPSEGEAEKDDPADVPVREEIEDDEPEVEPPERPDSIKVALQLVQLRNARKLLEVPAQPIFAKKKAIADAALQTAVAAGEEMDPWEPGDTVVEACKGGFLRLRFELPDGTWVETEEVQLTPEMAQAAEGEGAPVYDVFELSKITSPEAAPLYYDVEVQQDENVREDRLLRFNRWLKRGMPMKIFFREAPPPSAEELVAMREAAEADSKAKAKAKAAPKPTASPIPPPPAEEDGEAPPQPIPEEEAVGGAVVPLEELLAASAKAGINDGNREAGYLPEFPQPMVATPDVRIVPMARFLEPNVQVPLAEKALKKEWGVWPKPHGPPTKPDAAVLSLRVLIYAGEPPVEEEEPPPVDDPKKKGKK